MKKVLKILTLVMLIITIIKIGDTYAKYFATANTATLSQDIAKWIIKINELDIKSETGESVELEIDNFGNFSNNYTAPNKIAPFSEGYVDIKIDPTGTDVAVKYDVELDTTNDSNLAITAWLEMQSEERTLIKTGEHKYTAIFTLDEIQDSQTDTLRCYIMWANDENKNEIDTEVAGEVDAKVKVNVRITATQYLGEEIVEYV